MRRSIRLGFFLLMLCAALGSACQRASNAPPIAAEDLAKRLGVEGAPVVLDVRSPAEYATGHIPGAINIPHNELAWRLAEIPTGKSGEIVVHCQAGKRAAAAEGVLAEAGYTDVRDLQGHMAGWVDADLPVESGGTP